MNKGQITLLIALTTEDYYTLTSLSDYLTRFGRGMAQDIILRNLKAMIGIGYVTGEGYPCRYSLTINGRNALNDLEKRCRETRYDK